MRQLLRSYLPFNVSPRLLRESKERNGTIMLRGLLQLADTPNGNGRIYPQRILEREIVNYQGVIKEKRSMGELDHPPSSDKRDDPLTVMLERASHIIREIEINGKEVYGVVQVLSTPMGRIIESLVNDDVTVGISSRALGSVKTQGKHDVIQEDLEISCWDFVSLPSVPNAYMTTINEGRVPKVEVVDASRYGVAPDPRETLYTPSLQQAQSHIEHSGGLVEAKAGTRIDAISDLLDSIKNLK